MLHKMAGTSPMSSLSRLSQLPATDKGGIILDIGSAHTRIGMSGEAAPRVIVPSVAHLQQENKHVRVWDVSLSDVGYLRRVLRAFVCDIYVKYLRLHPKDHRVVVLEDIASPSIFRNTLASVLFKDFKVPYAVFVPDHLMTLFTIGRQSALVVRVGNQETTVLPVYEGIPVVAAWQESPVGAKHLHRSVAKHLREGGSVRECDSKELQPGSALRDDVLEQDIANVTARACFVRPRDNERIPLDVEYPLTGGEKIVIVDGRTRAFSADVFFESADCESIAKLALEALKRCSIDSRKELAENIVVVGGVVRMQGFMSRLKEEMLALLDDSFLRYRDTLALSAFKFHQPPTQPNCVEWLGASIFGSQEKAVLERAVTMDGFLETNQLPDWMSCDPAQREELHTSLPMKKSAVSPAVTRRTQGRAPGSPPTAVKELFGLKTKS